jgi:hypothetical protein
VRLTIHNLLGERVAVLVDGQLLAGHHEFRFPAGDTSLPSGVYVAECRAGSWRKVIKLWLLK